jgi:hypothetical protein
MNTNVVVADWIKRIVDDERQRDAARVREEETAARKADLVRVHGRRLIEELRATVTRDVEAFLAEVSAIVERLVQIGPQAAPTRSAGAPPGPAAAHPVPSATQAVPAEEGQA